MAATLHDVARLAGVSIKTVSNVINDYPHIRPATREKVEKAIAELGYTPNLTARNLRSGRTGAIALAVPDLGLAYFAELAAAVIAEAERAHLVVLIEQTGGDRDRELELLRSGASSSPTASSSARSAWGRTTWRRCPCRIRWSCSASGSSTGPSTT